MEWLLSLLASHYGFILRQFTRECLKESSNFCKTNHNSAESRWTNTTVSLYYLLLCNVQRILTKNINIRLYSIVYSHWFFCFSVTVHNIEAHCWLRRGLFPILCKFFWFGGGRFPCSPSLATPLIFWNKIFG